MKATHELLGRLSDEITRVVQTTTGQAGDYVRDFARYSAAYATSLLDAPTEDAWERWRAQVRAAAETIKEISEQALQRILERLEDALRFTLNVVAAAV